MAHHHAQKAYLTLELRARLAKKQVRTDEQALMDRQIAFLELRDQSARVLA